MRGLKRGVVGAGVIAEIFLDRPKLRGHEALAGKDERLDDPGDASVAIAERMNRDDVQMRHRGPDDYVRVQITVLEPVDHLSHKGRRVCRGRSLVDQPPIVACNPDRTGTPQTGVRLTLEVARVEVQVKQNPVQPAERRIAGHDADVIHRESITGDRRAIEVLRIGPLGSADERDRFRLRYVKALDRRRALDRCGTSETAQGAHPWSGTPHLVAEPLTQAVELAETLGQSGFNWRSRDQHVQQYRRLYVCSSRRLIV